MTARRPYPFFNIETKSLPAGDNIYHPEPAEFVELLMKVIKENQMEELCNYSVFRFQNLTVHASKIPKHKDGHAD